MSLKLNTIKEGDCIRRMAKLPDGSVNLVFADPPFNIGYEYDVYDDKRSADDYLDWSTEWMRQVHRVLADDGTFWLAIGDEFAAELKVSAQRELGFHCRSWVIWYYTFGVNCKKGFSRSHTHLFHFVKDPANFVFNSDDPAVRVPSARQLVYADKRANPKGRLPDNTWILRPQDAPEGFQPDHDTWYYPRVAGTFKEREGFHGCQMPEQLLGRIIRLCSSEGDTVLDPFSGSGTSVVVAKKLARNYLGFDLSKDYVAHIRKRLKKTKVGADLDGAVDPLVSAPSTSKGKQRKPEGQAELENGSTSEDPATGKSKTKKPISKKAASKKSGVKKAASKKAGASKKSTGKKSTSKQPSAKKPAAAKTDSKKAAAKKRSAKKVVKEDEASPKVPASKTVKPARREESESPAQAAERTLF